ncbi:MAG: PPK2 family polyphosphate kinase [Fimbriimonas sp.]
MSIGHRVNPGSSIDLMKVDPGEASLSKEDAKLKAAELAERLRELLELMYAAGQHALLVVLQGRDTAGKDGTIRLLLDAVNVQGNRVASFKAPSQIELSHDFLWRVHRETPAKGTMTIFNRSHYEDVLVVRVHDLVPRAVWSKRYDHINAFESLLVASGTLVVKFMLHVSKDEQERRLREREEDTTKAWKLSVGDWQEREFWDEYTEAYEDALRECSTEDAPWIVVPADKKWFRDIVVLQNLVEALEPHEKTWRESLRKLGEKALVELKAFRAKAN